MSGVGSTNAMKKGSANNPFLAYSEADMQGYLNSAYTGCIVKYTGPSTKKGIEKVTPLDSAKDLGDAQNLIANLLWAKNIDSTYGEIAHPAGGTIRENPWHFTVVNKTTRKTQYIQEVCVDTVGKKFVDTSKGGDLAWLLSDWYLLSLDDSLSFQDSLTKNVIVLECEEAGENFPPYWPLESGWQKNCFNTEGKIILWGYEDTVELSCPIVYSYNRGPFWIEPYVVNELYKVVYGDDQYYFEEFYYISENVTTAIVEDVAPGKTFYDFTGTKQTGIGTKINPYIANTIDELKSFPIGSFIKWLGPNKTVLDTTTGQMLIQNEVYRAVEDGDILQYVILPMLSNPGTAADLTKGKQLIDGDGKVVEGIADGEIDYTQDVMFWDYDGKLLHACTLAEAKAMTELPTVPDHTDKGLVFYKWNYTLDDIKNINHGADIGALYATIDGKTHLFFNIVSDLTKEITLYVIKSYNSQAASLTIDWGDGTDVETYVWDQNTTPSSANFPKHTYATLGQYEVKIEHISDYRNQWLYLGSTTYSISDARNLFGQSLRYTSPNAISTVLTKVYVGKRMHISCGNCVNLTEISLYDSLVAPCGLKYTQVKHVNTSNSIGLNAFNYSAIETFSCSATSIEAAFCLSYCAIKRIACKAYTQTYGDTTALTLPSLRTCIWPRYLSYRLQLDIPACKKVALDAIAQYDNTASSPSLYLVAATKLYMQRFYTYGNNTTINAGIISAPLLQQFIIDNATPIALTAAFTKIPATCQYYVPDEAVDAYKTTAGWSDMADRIYPMSALIN